MPARPVQPGKLRHRVKVLDQVQKPNSYGEPVPDPVVIAERWASVEPVSEREAIRAQQVFAEVTHLIGMRYLAGLRPKMQLQFGARTFELGPALNPGEQGHTTLMEITAKELV